MRACVYMKQHEVCILLFVTINRNSWFNSALGTDSIVNLRGKYLNLRQMSNSWSLGRYEADTKCPLKLFWLDELNGLDEMLVARVGSFWMHRRRSSWTFSVNCGIFANFRYSDNEVAGSKCVVVLWRVAPSAISKKRSMTMSTNSCNHEPRYELQKPISNWVLWMEFKFRANWWITWW